MDKKDIINEEKTVRVVEIESIDPIVFCKFSDCITIV